MNRKLRIFLGATVNYTNAQNLNCLALAKHLDKSKYEVRTIVGYSGNLPIEKIAGVQYYKMRYPARIWLPICFIFGLLWCDVAYLPKPECWRLCAWLVRWLKKPSFKTIEGMFIGTNLDKALALTGSQKELSRFLTYTDHTYSITESMKTVNEKILGLKTEVKVLYLGVEGRTFHNEVIPDRLADVCIIGSNLFYKGLDDFFVLAKDFPQLRFHVIGSGMGAVDPQTEVVKLGLSNVTCHGSLSHAQLRDVLKNMQLHIFPSRAEGFPKVTLECAAAGVPSLVYGDYGADEWITTGHDGFVVKTLDEMRAVVQDLLDHPEKLPSLATHARELAQRFDWSVLVKDWEKVIDELAINLNIGKN